MTDQSALARPAAQTPPQANWFSRKIHKSETFRAYAVLSPALLFLGFAILIPFAILVVLSFWTPVGFDFNREFTLKNYRDIMERPIYGTLLWRSLWISTMATVFTVLLCYPMAYFVAFHVHRNKMVWIVLMTLPFWTSYLLRVFAWKVVLGYEGVINSGLIWVGWIEAPLQFLLYSPTAVIITLAHAWAAFAILPLYVSLEKIDKSLLEAATDLGDGPMRRFFRITLPLSLPGVISASILIFIPTTGDYITPALLGGPNGMMIGNLIQMQFGPTNNWPMGAALAIVLMLTIAAICAAFILIIFFVRKRIT